MAWHSSAVLVVVSGLLASSAEAFMVPNAMAAPTWLSKPLLATRIPHCGMRPTSSRRSELRMGGLSPPVSMKRPASAKKRAFLWLWSERLLDKTIYFLQILIRRGFRIFYNLATLFSKEPAAIKTLDRVPTKRFSVRPPNAPPSYLGQPSAEGFHARTISREKIGRKLNGYGCSQSPSGPPISQSPIRPPIQAPTFSKRSAVTFCAPPTLSPVTIAERRVSGPG